jgi:ribosomal protein S27AE
MGSRHVSAICTKLTQEIVRLVRMTCPRCIVMVMALHGE